MRGRFGAILTLSDDLTVDLALARKSSFSSHIVNCKII